MNANKKLNSQNYSVLKIRAPVPFFVELLGLRFDIVENLSFSNLLHVLAEHLTLVKELLARQIRTPLSNRRKN